MLTTAPSSCWVLLTMGDRPDALAAAVLSIHQASGGDRAEEGAGTDVVVVLNGAPDDAPIPRCRTVPLSENVGVPAGRDAAMAATDADVVFFLDDDARVVGDWPTRVLERFAADDRLAVVSMRLLDEHGKTSRRHVPRFGRRGLERSGPVPTFLGGASAIRRSAYEEAGGYWGELWYGHEELDLSWRLLDRGWSVFYEPEAVVFYPCTTISRHASGWWHTGRNRVWIARRDLPWPVMIVHTFVWLCAGTWRAPSGGCRWSYLLGWWAGWRRVRRSGSWGNARRNPIAWSTVWRLTCLGRPPVI